MKIEILNIHYPNPVIEEIKMKLSELLAANVSLAGQVNHVETEVVNKLADLQAAIDKLTAALADVELTAEQAQSVADLQTAVQALDDIIPEDIPEPKPVVDPVVDPQVEG